MKAIRLLIRFLRYYFRAKTRYNVHSPFVFEFIEKVLEDERAFYAFEEIEEIRDSLTSNRDKIKLTDFGAGSKFHSGRVRSIGSIARHTANRPRNCRLLFRIIDLYKPSSILELGTSLGISTLYQSAASQDAKVVTIEGDPAIADIALRNFEKAGRDDIQLVEGVFDERLPEVLNSMKAVDYAFIDGNHRKEPTLNYFNECLKHIHDKSILVFDDIHWSSEMEEAWVEIKGHPDVSLSLDLFNFGVVFFRKEFKVKEEFTLIKWSWKPWAIGVGDYFS